MAKSRLHAALANEKGIDTKKIVQKRKQKEALRQKRKAGKGGAEKATNKKKPEEPADDTDEDDDDWEGAGEGDDEEDEEDSENEDNPLFDVEAEEGSSGDESEDDENENGGINLSRFGQDESSSDSEVEMEEKIARLKNAKSDASKPSEGEDKKQKKTVLEDDEKEKQAEDSESDEEEEEDIDMEDLEDLDPEEKEDLVPHTRTTINNHTALLASLNRIALPTGSSIPFATHQVITSSKATAESIPDIQDDLARELAFYAQSLEAAKLGRSRLLKEGVPFTRPSDYFAEMVKSDGQMEKVKAKLVEEATAKKAAAEARKQRDLKKFGKQVQVAKQQERAKQKRETLEKIKTLKRKRQEGSGTALGATEADDLFDVAVENEIAKHTNKSGGAGKRGRDGEHGGGAPSAKRQRKDQKYGFGGKKRHAKSGDAQSAGDLSGFSARRMKTGGGGGKGGKVKVTRPGKNRRKAAAGKR